MLTAAIVIMWINSVQATPMIISHLIVNSFVSGHKFSSIDDIAKFGWTHPQTVILHQYTNSILSSIYRDDTSYIDNWNPIGMHRYIYSRDLLTNSNEMVAEEQDIYSSTGLQNFHCCWFCSWCSICLSTCNFFRKFFPSAPPPPTPSPYIF